MQPGFKPLHINATAEDMLGNGDVGRYFFLPGSEGRARQIAETQFANLQEKSSSRAHTLFLGTIEHDGAKIDVGTISTGMGCSSLEIIVTELLLLGAKRLMRVGTAGSLQPNWVKPGHVINVRSAIRDENVTSNYLPIEYPAVASSEYIRAIEAAAKQLEISDIFHTGIAHTKSSLYGRQLGEGPKVEENKRYMQFLRDTGVIATEMETAALFILGIAHNQQLSIQYENHPHKRIMTGAVLAIASDSLDFAPTDTIKKAESCVIDLAIEAVKQLHKTEST